MKNLIFYLPVFALLISGCEKTNFSGSGVNQLALFQVEYVNYAWGYSHNGIIIDSAGNVRPFKFPAHWNYPDKEGYITESGMNENIQQLSGTTAITGQQTLQKYFDLLLKAADGKLSDPYNRMYDAGVTLFSGYIYYPESKRYKRVIIKQSGDWAIDNNSSEAEELYKWLLSLYIDSVRSISK